MLAGRYRRASLSGAVIALWVALADVALFSLLNWFALYAATPTGSFSALKAAAISVALAASGVAVLKLINSYETAALRRLGSSLTTAAAVHCGGCWALALTEPSAADPARLAAAGTIAAALALPPARILLAAWLHWARDSNLLERRAVLVGGGDNARRVIEGLAARADGDIRVAAIFDDREGGRSPDLVLDVPRIGRFADLMAFARAAEIDLVIITLPATAEGRIQQLLETLSALPVPIHLSAYSDDLAFPDGDNSGLVALVDAAITPGTRLQKRLFDLASATVALMFLAPVMAAAAVAIRLDSPGPVLFTQWRTGFGERPVAVWKFRTMRQEANDPAAARPVRRGDARVTRVGRFLRKTSIDELPQLVNVLRGDLSLVGPRPHALDARSAAQERFDALVQGYARRHRLPPGITGWAQIHGYRGTVEDAAHLRARVSHDLWYVENWSVWLDLRILLRTPVSLLRTHNAF
jgi:Undecaprenyl-phosphate glucose phosphotransferase